MNLRSLSASIIVIAILTLSVIPFARASNLNYSQFSSQLGDATYACPGVTVTNSDITMTSNSLTSNVNKKAAQVHAYSSYKQSASATTLLYSIQFSIPYQPKPDINQQYNPQTIESEAAIWHGDIKTKYNVGIQWALNPWQTAHINVWRNGAWVSVLNTSISPNTTYRYTLYVDINNPSASYVKLEYQWWIFWFTVGSWQSYSSQTNPSWGSDFSWWVSAENVSASPNCSLGIGFINTNNWYNPTVSVA